MTKLFLTILIGLLFFSVMGCLETGEQLNKHIKEGKIKMTNQNDVPVSGAKMTFTIQDELGDPDGTQTFTSDVNGIVTYKIYMDKQGSFRVDYKKTGCTDPSWGTGRLNTDLGDVGFHCGE